MSQQSSLHSNSLGWILVLTVACISLFLLTSRTKPLKPLLSIYREALSNIHQDREQIVRFESAVVQLEYLRPRQATLGVGDEVVHVVGSTHHINQVTNLLENTQRKKAAQAKALSGLRRNQQMDDIDKKQEQTVQNLMGTMVYDHIRESNRRVHDADAASLAGVKQHGYAMNELARELTRAQNASEAKISKQFVDMTSIATDSAVATNKAVAGSAMVAHGAEVNVELS